MTLHTLPITDELWGVFASILQKVDRRLFDCACNKCLMTHLQGWLDVFNEFHVWSILYLFQLQLFMMTSSNGNIFRIIGPLCREFTGEFPTKRPVTQSFDVFFDLRLNKKLSKQSWGWWFEMPSRPLWCHSNGKQYNIAKCGLTRPYFVRTSHLHMRIFVGQFVTGKTNHLILSRNNNV